MRFVVIEKPIGQTPLEAIRAWKTNHVEYKDVSASYAGRLDPMASGKLIILLGDECKKQARYTKLDKEYLVEILLDIGSDTGDVLGITDYAAKETVPAHEDVRRILAAERGTHQRAYPVYSSKTVSGKPLFLHALQNTLSNITIPTHPETLYRLSLLEVRTISNEDLQSRIVSLLSLAPTTNEPSKVLGADFRIKDVRASWNTVFAHMPARSFTVLRIRVTCGSGAYMRTLAARIGKGLGTSAIALSIQRITIGTYLPFLTLWAKKFT